MKKSTLVAIIFGLLTSCVPTVLDSNSSTTTTNSTTTTVPTATNQVIIPSPNVFMTQMLQNTTITFHSLTDGAKIFTYLSDNSTDKINWSDSNSVTLSECGEKYVYAKATKDGFTDSQILAEHIFVVKDFAENDKITTKIDKTTPKKWATAVTNYQVGINCAESWQTQEKALGEAVGDSFDIVCLGDGGQITLSFDVAICDGKGPDFAVFENGFSDTFLELGFVEVSSNGVDFIRFDNCSLTECNSTSLNGVNPNDINNLAGKYKQGFGTAFDLHELIYRDEVVEGKVDLNKIAYVRVIDIIGDSTDDEFNDSYGNHIYDPFPCGNISAGFDLDAIGVINWANKK